MKTSSLSNQEMPNRSNKILVDEKESRMKKDEKMIDKKDVSKNHTNNSSTFQPTNEIETKNAVDLTTARFRMMANADDFARPFEAKVDNNMSAERYSMIDLVLHVSEIAYKGCTDVILKDIIDGRRMFRRLYFNINYCLYFEKLTINSPLIMYRLNTNPKPGVWIDQVVQWYPIFPSENEPYIPHDHLKKASLSQEKLSFLQHLKLEFREILLEYYELTDIFSHKLMIKLIELVENHIDEIVTHSMRPFEMINEVCKKCGESFENKSALINHHDFNACRLPPVHRCQCGTIFMTHFEWQSHCFNVHMSCPSFAWHIWRHKRLSTCYSFSCDGCQHIFTGFLKFWHHCCFCPFFMAFLVGNCAFCTPQARLETYQHAEIQRVIGRPHSDRVGITIIKEWVKITQLKFNVKLAIAGEPSLKM